jgi:formamidopyrimidine-DNA glycosylase
MLAGHFHLAKPKKKLTGGICFSLDIGGEVLEYHDKKKMGKVYVVAKGEYGSISGYLNQGVAIDSEGFNFEVFKRLIKGDRRQVRVFLMDHSKMSALGNAYSDEVLFEAGIHPKTFCNQLDPKEIQKLYESVVGVVQWAIDEVEGADKPLGSKVRNHVRVRNRKGEACQRCGTTIRRTQVYGYDSFFCPHCQPLKTSQLIDWSMKPPMKPPIGPHRRPPEEI